MQKLAIWMLQVRFLPEPKLTAISDLCLSLKFHWGIAKPASWPCCPKCNNNAKKIASWQKVKLEAKRTWKTGGEHCGESSCCSHCCQEDRGWLYLLLIDIFLVFLPCFAREQAQLPLAQLKLPRMFWCCPQYCEALFIARIHWGALA